MGHDAAAAAAAAVAAAAAAVPVMGCSKGIIAVDHTPALVNHID
jgi:hypothetical protein